MSFRTHSTASRGPGLLVMLISVVVALALTLSACSKGWIDPSGSPSDQPKSAATINAQLRQEVCTNIPYITYDSSIDTEETRRQIDAVNAVLFEVYECSLR